LFLVTFYRDRITGSLLPVMKRSWSSPSIANPFKALQPQAAPTGAKVSTQNKLYLVSHIASNYAVQVFLSDDQVLVQTPDIPRVFLVEPEHNSALRISLMGNGRSRRKAWLEQVRVSAAGM
jgi:hypothetical protein